MRTFCGHCHTTQLRSQSSVCDLQAGRTSTQCDRLALDGAGLVLPFPEAILVEQVGTDRLVAVRDPSPPMGEDTLMRRHVWIDASGGHQYPDLVIAWRPRDDGWEGYMAVARDWAVVVTWEQASRLHPVCDGRRLGIAA